jgi:4-hydroxythreonine-4-phosphate dehydrogenase
MKPVIAITMGDFNGIGPEVALKAITSKSVKNIAIPILIGSVDVFEYYAKLLKFEVILKEIDYIPQKNKSFIPIIPVRKFLKPKIKPGIISFEAGRLAAESVLAAALLCLKRDIDGMVTAPLSKEAINLEGFAFPGQTEILAAICGSNQFAMILTSGNFRVGLVTIHLPMKDVTKSITTKLVFDKINIFHNSLRKDFKIRTPKIAILGLNPHAGENGRMGKEEITTIIPAMKLAARKKIKVEGPFSADGFFGSRTYKEYDGILAMYHDQGLIPLKMEGFNNGVNFTAGLPIVRTSPDHGTAFSLAGKGVANPNSTIEAVKLAVEIINNRKSIATKPTKLKNRK